MVIVWIKNFYDITSKVLLLNCLLIITLVKRIESEAVDWLSIPDTKSIYDAVAVTYDWKVVRNSLNCLISFLEVVVTSVLINSYANISAELNFCSILISLNLK